MATRSFLVFAIPFTSVTPSQQRLDGLAGPSSCKNERQGATSRITLGHEGSAMAELQTNNTMIRDPSTRLMADVQVS